MAKIILNNKTYTIDESTLAPSTTSLQSHLSTTMSGSGAVINFGGVAYNVDSAKLTAAMNSFVSHLGTIAGNGSKVVISGVEYAVDSTKISSAMSELETAFGELGTGTVLPLPTLTAPTVELSETTLNIYDDEGLATSYDILVDGEVKATVEKVSTVSIKLVGASLGLLGGGSVIYVKFGSAPSSSDDYDYYDSMGYATINDKDGNTFVDPLVTVSPIAYIWSERGGYEFTSSTSSEHTSIQNTYDNPAIVDLSQAQGTEGTWKLYLYSWGVD